MASVKLGGGVVEIRGSIAGNTFSRNRYGAYMRARISPVNPNSEKQSRVRGIMSVVSKDWFDTLTAEQREAWIQFAANMPVTNRLGEVINLSGFNQYVASNQAALNAGLPAIAAGPTTYIKPGVDVTSVATGSESTQEVSVVFDDTRDWVDEDGAGMIVQVGLPQNASIEFFNGPWRHAGVIEGDSVAAPTTPAAIASPFVITEDQKLFVRTRIIRADGRLSDWFQSSSVCGA